MILYFYSHIPARCDLKFTYKIYYITISTHTSLRDVTWWCDILAYYMVISTHTSLRDVTLQLVKQIPYNEFLLTHPCEMWPASIPARHPLEYFYSHIPARCDSSFDCWLVDILNFYSHIPARCDNVVNNSPNSDIISTHTSLRDVTRFLLCSLQYIHQFLLTHPCEMWLISNLSIGKIL